MSRRGWALFLTLSVIWGLPYLLIKVAVEDLSPAVVVSARTGLAALILLPVAAAQGAIRPVLARWRIVVVFALIEIVGPFGLLAFAETRLSSSLTGLLVAATPIVGAVVAHRMHLDDRFDRGRIAGLLVGLAGVGCLVGFDVRGGDLVAVAAVGLVAVGYAIGPVIIATRLHDVPGVGVSGWAMLVASLCWLPFAVTTRPDGPVPAEAWGSVAGLGVVCTAIAFIVFFALIAEVGPSRTTVITYLNPAVAVTLGVLVLDESLTLGIVIGFPLVLAGSYLATRKGPALEAEPHA